MSLFLETLFFLTLEILTKKMVPRTEDQKGGARWPPLAHGLLGVMPLSHVRLTHCGYLRLRAKT